MVILTAVALDESDKLTLLASIEHSPTANSKQYSEDGYKHK